MGYVFYNPNPDRKFVGDCVIRAISRILSMDWEETYLGVAAMGLALHDMPSSDDVWGEFLRRRGFVKNILPDTCQPLANYLQQTCNQLAIFGRR